MKSSIGNNSKQLKVGDTIKVLTVDGSIRTGKLEIIKENTIIVSQNTNRFVAKKSILFDQGYCYSLQ